MNVLHLLTGDGGDHRHVLEHLQGRVIADDVEFAHFFITRAGIAEFAAEAGAHDLASEHASDQTETIENGRKSSTRGGASLIAEELFAESEAIHCCIPVERN